MQYSQGKYVLPYQLFQESLRSCHFRNRFKRLTLELLSAIAHLSAQEASTDRMLGFADRESISSNKRQSASKPDSALTSTCSSQILDLSCLVSKQTI